MTGATMVEGRLERPFELKGRRVFVAGHRGMVGSALVRRLASEDCEILTVGRELVDLRRPEQTRRWLENTRPDVVIVAAAKVGGILANATFPADFIYDNLMIEASLMHGAHQAGVQRLLFLGSSCIYPKLAAQPIAEDALLEGPLEPTNKAYAIAKIAGIELVEAYRRQHGADFISAMPTNLYGPGDNFDPETSHVVPALMRKMHEGKVQGLAEVEVWGTGRPRREFLHVDDLADACVHLLERFAGPGHINVGCGKDVTIAELAEMIRRIVGFDGELRFDPSKPDGTPRKLLDVTRLRALGWRPRISLETGLEHAYRWFLEHRPD